MPTDNPQQHSTYTRPGVATDITYKRHAVAADSAHTRLTVAAETYQMSAQQLCFLTVVRDHKMTSHST